jgi:hypothetical protein
MARHFGLPALTTATYTDTFVPDVQCGVEKALAALAGMAAGADVGMFGGDLNDAMTISYEQLLIDYEIWELAGRLLRGVGVSPDALAQEVIERVRHGGSYLTTSTRWGGCVATNTSWDSFFIGMAPAPRRAAWSSGRTSVCRRSSAGRRSLRSRRMPSDALTPT